MGEGDNRVRRMREWEIGDYRVEKKRQKNLINWVYFVFGNHIPNTIFLTQFSVPVLQVYIFGFLISKYSNTGKMG